MASIFSKIVKGEIPSYKVAEDEDYYAFLDINPLQKGHTLVIPKKETDYIFELSDEELAGLMVFAKEGRGMGSLYILRNFSRLSSQSYWKDNFLPKGWSCRTGPGCASCACAFGSFEWRG